MTTEDALLESYRRQAQMLGNLAGLVTAENRTVKSDPQGWTLDYHLAHVHEVRYWWLSQVQPGSEKAVGDVLQKVGEECLVIDDLDEIRRQLALSATAVEQTTAALLASGTQKAGPYDHPVIFMQHMLWHEGYHFGVMMAALRNSGAEPSDEWSERHVWELWRGPEN